MKEQMKSLENISKQFVEKMNDNDRVLILVRLTKLNEIEKDSLNEAIEIKEFWKGRVKEYGRNATSGNLKITYGEELDSSIDNMEYLENRIKENERLIEALEGEKWSD